MFNRHGVPKQQLDALRGVPLFERLSDKVLARIAPHVEEFEVPAQRVLTSEGQVSREAFIVQDGVAEIRIAGELVGETRAGELIGEIGVIKGAPRSATVVAKTPMRLLVLSVQDLRWLADDRDLAARVQENLDRHLGGGANLD